MHRCNLHANQPELEEENYITRDTRLRHCTRTKIMHAHAHAHSKKSHKTAFSFLRLRSFSRLIFIGFPMQDARSVQLASQARKARSLCPQTRGAWRRRRTFSSSNGPCELASWEASLGSTGGQCFAPRAPALLLRAQIPERFRGAGWSRILGLRSPMWNFQKCSCLNREAAGALSKASSAFRTPKTTQWISNGQCRR